MTNVSAPSLEHLEHAAELLAAETARLLDRARENARVRQDIEAEDDRPNVRWVTAGYDQRRIARMLTRAHVMLVHPSDERYPGACRVAGYLRDAELGDGPWADIGPVVEGMEAAA